MASLRLMWTMSLACGALLLCGRAQAQLAPGTGDNGPIAFDGETAERKDAEHLTIWHGGKSGPVNVVQNGARLVCDTLYIYSYGPDEGPNAQQAKPAGASKAAPQDDAPTTSSIKKMVAEGHVFYVTQSENVRGDHGVYDAEPDTITMTGNVIAVQGKNVVRGDKMIMDRKSGQTQMFADASGRNNPNRVRAVIYNDNQNGQGQGSQGQGSQGQGSQGQGSQGQTSKGQNATKAPPAPAKKP
jgi:lipopolysaccharide export system protein LptA